MTFKSAEMTGKSKNFGLNVMLLQEKIHHSCKILSKICTALKSLLCSFQLRLKDAGEYMLEVLYNSFPIGWSSYNVSVESSACSFASTKLSADTQPVVAGQPYQLYFTVSDDYGNPCKVGGSKFAVVALGQSPLIALVTGINLFLQLC